MAVWATNQGSTAGIVSSKEENTVLSSLAQPRDEPVLSQPVEKTHMQVEQIVRKVSKKPTKSKNQKSRSVFQSMDVTSSASQEKRFENRPGQFVASELRKRKVEVSVKNLSQHELQQLYQAKQNENNSTLLGLWGAMQWPCTQTDAKKVCAVSMLQSSPPVATVRTLMKSNRILEGDEVRYGGNSSACTPRREVGLVRCESCKVEDVV